MTGTESPINRAALERLENLGGQDLLFRVIDQFLEKAPMRMDAACDRGRAGDLSGVQHAIASIKSAAGNLGATEVSDFAGRIERLATEGAKDIVLPLLCQLDDILGKAVTWLKKEKITLQSGRDFH